jgi:hypothetical protein
VADDPKPTATSSTAARPNPRLDMPEVGQCRVLSRNDLPPASNTTPAAVPQLRNIVCFAQS